MQRGKIVIGGMKHALFLAIGAVALLLGVGRPAQAATVNAASVAPTFIGNVVAGKAYRVTASGRADLCTGCNGGQGLNFTPDGRPTSAFAPPYAAFYPNGLDYDPSSGPTAYGIGGPQRLYGALLGTFTASPMAIISCWARPICSWQARRARSMRRSTTAASATMPADMPSP